MATAMRLTPEVKAALRRRFRGMEETGWVAELAAQRGWREANRRYLESMREQGVQEMAALMEDLGVSGTVSTEEALELLETALAVYLPEAEARRTTDDEGQLVLLIAVRDCPTYARIERSGLARRDRLRLLAQASGLVSGAGRGCAGHGGGREEVGRHRLRCAGATDGGTA